VYDDYDAPARSAGTLRVLAALLLALLAAGAAGAALLSDRRLAARADERADALAAEVAELREREAALAARVDAAEARLGREQSGIAPLAERVLRSVFTVETADGFGSGFVAWRADGATYLLTAAHVVEGADGPHVTVSRKGGRWSGEVTAVDARHDLAAIRISGRPDGAEPLWQDARAGTARAGDELLLVGSPFGLEGTVTTGVVSRVTPDAIQTDAAANPGNSGGPALDREGRVVGVLVSGGAQNVNFAVPVRLACERLRRCRDAG